jgi:hypothetical protein
VDAVIWLLACVDPKPVTETCDTCDGACQQDVFATSSAQHVDGEVAYEYVPPAAGNHDACWATWGVHSEAVADENWVHNLEHGGVVFLHDCTDCDDDVAALNAWVATLEPGRALSTPYPEMDWPFAAVSWGHRLLLGCLDLDAFQTFYDVNVGNAPEDVTSEPLETCGMEPADTAPADSGETGM